MTAYVIQILFDDETEATVLDLTGVELADAEAFTAQFRYDVEEAKDIDAPFLEFSTPGASQPQTLDPRRVRSIDLEQAS